MDALAPEPHWLRRQRHDNDNPINSPRRPNLVFTDPERLALAGFLAGYRGLTRDAYALDLRQFVSWCERHSLKLFSVHRTDIELYARALEEAGRPGPPWPGGLCTVAGFYRYAEEEGLVPGLPGCPRPASPARLRDATLSASTATRSVRSSSLLVSAQPAEHALISLLALNGLRVSEAIGADIEALGLERGHRTLTVLRKGGKTVTVPLAPRTARAVDLAIGERLAGPIFLSAHGERLDRHGAGRFVRRVAHRAGIDKRIGPHTLRHAFITAVGRGRASA